MKTFDDVITMTFYDVILYFRLHSGTKKVENRNFFVFHLNSLEIWYGGNFQMLISQRKRKLKLEKRFEQTICNFLPFLAKIILNTLQ